MDVEWVWVSIFLTGSRNVWVRHKIGHGASVASNPGSLSPPPESDSEPGFEARSQASVALRDCETRCVLVYLDIQVILPSSLIPT